MKKSNCILLAYFLFLLSIKIPFTNVLLAEETNKKMAGCTGLGLTYPMGDLGDLINYTVPLLFSFQFEIIPNITFESDLYCYLFTSEEKADDFDAWQIGIGGRFWFSKGFKEGNAFEDIYIGAGFARTDIEVNNYDDDYNTLVIKGGYIFLVNEILLDAGIRYDFIDMDDWFDQPITLYAMIIFKF